MSGGFPIRFHPSGITVEARPEESLRELLFAQGVDFPCGGTSACGGCKVQVLEGEIPITGEMRLALTPEQLESGWRLACQARATGPMTLALETWQRLASVADRNRLSLAQPLSGYGIAVDVGTTTVAVQLVDLKSGEVLDLRTALNPQAAWGADVMSRVQLSLHDNRLTSLIRDSIGYMVADLAGQSSELISSVVLVGNTVMHHLFCGFELETLSHAPFESPFREECVIAAGELGWNIPVASPVRFLRPLGGFVGSDILAGIVACGIPESDGLVALLDLGTNGEVSLGNKQRILCASTAAGPAFEAACISCGMRATTGAISRVFAAGGEYSVRVIGNTAPLGICGSGLLDAAAAALNEDWLLPRGRIVDSSRELKLAPGVALTQEDIRELQLAKAAVASGLRLLLKRWGAELSDLKTVFLGGAFGNYLDVESAHRIGLLEIAPSIVVPSGNTALRGARLALLSEHFEPSTPIDHVALASEPGFEDAFIDCVSFPSGPFTRPNPKRL